MTLTMCYNYQIVCSRTLHYLLMSIRGYTGLSFLNYKFKKHYYIPIQKHKLIIDANKERNYEGTTLDKFKHEFLRRGRKGILSLVLNPQTLLPELPQVFISEHVTSTRVVSSQSIFINLPYFNFSQQW